MAGPQYTTCVKAADYEDYSGIEVVLTGDWWEATDYMLHRKLICLGSVHPGTGADGKPRLVLSNDPGTSCAIGATFGWRRRSSTGAPASSSRATWSCSSCSRCRTRRCA